MKTIRRIAHNPIFIFLLIANFLFVSCSTDNGTDNSKTEQMLQGVTNETGIGIFKSIFFGVGDLANNIPQLKSQVQLTNGLAFDKREEVLEKLNILVGEITIKYPSFFENFKKQITSGEQLKIKVAIEQGSMMIKENIEIIFPEFKKVFKKVKTDINTGKLKFNENDNFNDYVETFQKSFNNGEYDNLLKENMISDNKEQLIPCTWAVACVAYFALAVHNTVAVTALIYFKFAFWGPSIVKIDKKNQVVGTDRPTNDMEDNLKTETLINEIAEYYAKN